MSTRDTETSVFSFTFPVVRVTLPSGPASPGSRGSTRRPHPQTVRRLDSRTPLNTPTRFCPHPPPTLRFSDCRYRVVSGDLYPGSRTRLGRKEALLPLKAHHSSRSFSSSVSNSLRNLNDACIPFLSTTNCGLMRHPPSFDSRLHTRLP